MLLGTASATMIGLLFVAATVGSGIFSQDRRGALRIFLSASVVQFGCILGSCLVILLPLQGWTGLGSLISAIGLFGLGYSGVAWRDTVQDGISPKIDIEDRIWYAFGPVIGYLLEIVAGTMIIFRYPVGRAALAVAMGTLLLVAIHNAWDITIWSITRHRD